MAEIIESYINKKTNNIKSKYEKKRNSYWLTNKNYK